MYVISFDQLYDCLNELGMMAKNAAEAISTFGSEIENYVENDISSICEAYYYSMPNNKRKMLGCPMRRYTALRKVIKNERRNSKSSEELS